jgi:hypothetical protein
VRQGESLLVLNVRVGAVFPPEKAAEAQRAFATGNIDAKVVLEID